MGFVQIIQFKTTKIDEINKIIDEFLASTEGKRTSTRGLIVRDRDNADTYMNIVEFPTYESAMQNSQLPETNEIASKLAALCDGPPTFFNLDVVRDDTME